jgi:biotin--protein ligase
MRAVLVYTGPGAGARSVQSAVDALAASLPGARVGTLNLQAVRTRAWHANTAALVLPGGADAPYARDLVGDGNASIREYVEGGGSFIGLCAGSYYGAAAISFEPGTPLAVEARRELAFFPGRALGAAAPGFEYATEAGAVAARLRWRRPGADSWAGAALDYCNGGPVFVGADGGPVPDEGEGYSVLARYDLPPPPPSSSAAAHAAAAGGVAAVACAVGAGVAVLCGTHPELAPAARWLPDALELAAVLDGDPVRMDWWESLLDAARLGALRGAGG